MKKFLGKTWAKAAAFLLFCLLILILAGSIVGLLNAYYDGWFNPDMSYIDSDHAYRIAYRELNNLENHIDIAYYDEGRGMPESSYQEYESDPVFSFVLYNKDGDILRDTRKENSEFVIRDEYLPTSEFAEEDNKAPVRADAYLNLPVGWDSSWYGSYSLYSWAISMRGAYLPIAFVCLILSVVLFVFLMMASGRKEDREEIVLVGLNRLPFDLYAAALIILGFMSVFAANELSYYYYDVPIQLAGLGLLVIAIAILFLALCMTAAARFKAGKWWKNTVIYRLLMLLRRWAKVIWRGIKILVRSLPITWKIILVYVGFVLFNLIFTLYATYGDEIFLFFVFVVDAAVLVGLVFITLQLNKLIKAGHAIAKGDMSVTVDTSKMYGDIKQHGKDLNNISLGVSRAVEERMKSERFKTELITNVSHDLKTPLTSIVNYVDLLKKENIENETAREYIEVLERQSEKLRKLTVDLVDASKASAGVINVNREKLELKELVDQCSGEYAEKLAAAGVELIYTVPGTDTVVIADGRLLWRVLDNLMQNVVKYSLAGTRAYITLEQKDKRAVLSVKNISREPLNIPAAELLERFVRGDSSRSSEGSGLGLSIALSLTELMGGTLELFLDGDLFKAVIEFDMV